MTGFAGTPRDRQASYVERIDVATGAIRERTWVGGGQAFAIKAEGDTVTLVGSLETIDLVLSPGVARPPSR